MNNEMIHALVTLIRQEEAYLEDFLGLLEQQKQLLVQNRAEDFENSVAQQEELLEKIRSLETERIQRVYSIAENLNIEEDQLTITRLVELSLGQVSDDLKQAKTSMNQLVDRIRRANQVNQYLIKRSLNVAQRSIDVLIDDNLSDVTYEKSGRIAGTDRRSLMVNKTL